MLWTVRRARQCHSIHSIVRRSRQGARVSVRGAALLARAASRSRRSGKVLVFAFLTTAIVSVRGGVIVSHERPLARTNRVNARDGTKYGKSRASATDFYTHHTQRISMAAAIGEAAGIHKAVRIMKQARCASERAARPGA